MGDGHVYGASHVGRRLYVLAVSFVLAVLCFCQFAKWLPRSGLWDFVAETSGGVSRHLKWQPEVEAFSCLGMASAAQNLREPLVAVSGAIFFPIGMIGANSGYHWYYQVLSYYLTALLLLYVLLAAGDLLYLHTCGMYTTNVIDETLTHWFLPSPVAAAEQAALRKMSSYQLDDVAKLTHGFSVIKSYLALTGSAVLLLAFTAREARLLGALAERSLIVFGPCRSVGLWEQVFGHGILTRIKGCDAWSDATRDMEEAAPIVAKALTGNEFYGTVGGGRVLRAAAVKEEARRIAAEAAAANKSGDGSIANVGVKMEGGFQCPGCRQKFDTEKAKEIHWKFNHDPSRS